jgi:predicted alpha/beta-hydrolase family hydrolase
MRLPDASKPTLHFNGPKNAAWKIALAHGAGAGMDTPFMNAFAEGIARAGLRVARFEFPYMANARVTGQKRPPDREPVLRQTWLQVVARLGRERLVIGGKSMGGRIASLIADEAGVAGLVCLGYPFHPTGNADRLRVEHLHGMQTRTLILQGTRDPIGNQEEVKKYRLSPVMTVHWLDDGNHDFTPRKASGRTQSQNWEEAITAAVDFIDKLYSPRSGLGP